MLKNYFKIAWKVMLRRKVFTVITLTVIALYLMMMTVMASFLDLVLGAYQPEPLKYQTLNVERMLLQKDGETVTWGGLSVSFIEQYIAPMQSPQSIVWGRTGAFRPEKERRAFRYVFVNPDFFNLFNLEFVEGRPLNAGEFENKAPIGVISEQLSTFFFDKESALGKEIKVNDQLIRIVGVFKDIHDFASIRGEVLLPYTIDPLQPGEFSEIGRYKLFLLGDGYDNMQEIKEEYKQIVQKADLPDPESYNARVSAANSQLDLLLLNLELPLEAVIILGTLFFALPASSLLNINTSRIIERYSEIGVRKAFGASSRVLVGQFIVENIIFSIIGGILGYVLSIGVAAFFIKFSQSTMHLVFPPDQSLVNWKVFLACLLLSFLYGFFTGVYPAWRMSRVHPVVALKH